MDSNKIPIFITMTKPIEIVKELFEHYYDINEKVNNINQGGCGVFAEKLFIALTKLGLKPKLVVLTDNSLAMKHRILDTEDYASYYGYAYIEHIAVKVGSILVDSEGIYKNVWDLRYCGEYESRQVCNTLTLEVLQEWNANARMWNDRFNRRHIKTIEKKLADCYKKVNQNLVVTK